MTDVFLFAGTTEGRQMADALRRDGLAACIFVATSYGGRLLKKGTNLRVYDMRLDEQEMYTRMEAEKPRIIIDATHPYAAEVSQNIRRAARRAQIRLLCLRREESMQEAGAPGGVTMVPSAEAAAAFLARTQGNILLTCGSKEMEVFCDIPDYQERLYARVLSTAEVVSRCAQLGLEGHHLIAMQGPFSKEMNEALLRQTEAEWMVTKEAGRAGGFTEKLEAAAQAGVHTLVIERPDAQRVQETCHGPGEEPEYYATVADCVREVRRTFHLSEAREYALVGIGPGEEALLTREAREAIDEADLVIGASRMLEMVSDPEKPRLDAYQPEEMQQYLEEHPQFKKIAVLLSGDPGFYSGAARLLAFWKGASVRVLPGISALQLLCARAKTSWQDVCPVSRHGRKQALLTQLRTHEKVFLLPEGELADLCDLLTDNGFEAVRMTVGSRLSYPEEELFVGPPQKLRQIRIQAPYAVLLEYPAAADAVCTPGLPDAAFLRGSLPMTKEEVRAVSLAKLRLTRRAVVYDIGAGTGSVSIEAARIAQAGTVYAIEAQEAGAELIRKNRQRFGLDNLEVIAGMAPEAFDVLPAPTHAFIGGSKGRLFDIVSALQEKNPHVRIVINAVTAETIAEAHQVAEQAAQGAAEYVQIAVTKEEAAGEYHMMRAQNPVTVISFGGTTAPAGER